MFSFESLIIFMSIIQFSSSQLPKSSTFYKKNGERFNKNTLSFSARLFLFQSMKINDKTNFFNHNECFARKINQNKILKL